MFGESDLQQNLDKNVKHIDKTNIQCAVILIYMQIRKVNLLTAGLMFIGSLNVNILL